MDNKVASEIPSARRSAPRLTDMMTQHIKSLIRNGGVRVAILNAYVNVEPNSGEDEEIYEDVWSGCGVCYVDVKDPESGAER